MYLRDIIKKDPPGRLTDQYNESGNCESLCFMELHEHSNGFRAKNF